MQEPIDNEYPISLDDMEYILKINAIASQPDFAIEAYMMMLLKQNQENLKMISDIMAEKISFRVEYYKGL